MTNRTSLKRPVRTALACALLTAGLAGSALAGDKFVMKLGHTLAPDNHYQLTALEFARLVKQKTHGAVEVQVFPQSQLGGEVQMTQALRTGTQDMMLSGQAAVVNTIKQWEVFDIPYLFDSVDDANRVLQGPVGKKFLDMMKPANMVGLAWISVGERNLFTAKKTIKSLDDVKDMKVRVMQSPGYIAGYRALGANPTPLAYNQLFLALSQGLVDGADTSPEQFIQDKFADVAKHYYMTRVNYLPVVLAIGKTSWNKLSPEQQKAMQESANEAAQFDIRTYHKQYDEALAQMKAKGIQVEQIDTKPWAAATEAARKELAAKIPDGTVLYKDIVAAKQGAAVAAK
ncbi:MULTISPECIES: TRAP transporter substrate-binding protein [Cupriavidus]|uniref:Solute-binding protein n=2 Tax=Cupriavidus TaxID=106589 RepID=A0ABM8XY80_9BURK|nr:MULTISPECIES: TRAP transporter substrate-binding protein [Cupriavidus]CAG9166343.1 Solute-binding protein [Cupriavidus pinatubonensis]CAG9185342.1 Solute-binding protein [Cupriavidus laharis]